MATTAPIFSILMQPHNLCLCKSQNVYLFYWRYIHWTLKKHKYTNIIQYVAEFSSLGGTIIWCYVYQIIYYSKTWICRSNKEKYFQCHFIELIWYMCSQPVMSIHRGSLSKICGRILYSDSRNLWTVMRAGGLAL